MFTDWGLEALIVKISVLPKAVYRFNFVLFKIPVTSVIVNADYPPGRVNSHRQDKLLAIPIGVI